jgi:hypothetical protein
LINNVTPTIIHFSDNASIREYCDAPEQANERVFPIVVFAGRALRNQRRLNAATRNAQHIEARLGLHFPTLLQRTREFQTQLFLQDEPVG